MTKIFFPIALNKVLKNYKEWNVLVKSWCKSTINKRTGLYNFSQKYLLKTWITNVKQTCIIHSILVGIPSNLVLSIRAVGLEGLLNRHNLLSMMKSVCWWSQSNSKKSKSYSLLNKISLSLSALLSVCCDLGFLCFFQQVGVFSS